MTIKNKLGFSSLTGKAYIGNLTNGMWDKREEIKDSDVIELVLNYLIYNIDENNEFKLTGKNGTTDFKISLEDLREVKNIKDLEVK